VKYGNRQSMELKSVSVPLVAKQTEDAQYHKMVECAEPVVWTKRMLQSLCNGGEKNKRWYSLFDQVYSIETLRCAWGRVLRNKGSAGVDNETIKMFELNAEKNIRAIHRQLKENRYKTSSIKRCWIDKDSSKEKRPLGIPTVRDRIVQTALRMVIEPIFEIQFSDSSYGFRPGRNQKGALRELDSLMYKGYTTVVDVDLKGYFDSIPHDKLMGYIEKDISDGKILGLIEEFMSASVLDDLQEWTPEFGCPQGAVISPLLSNIYLDGLDHKMKDAGYHLIRYADDFVIMCKTDEEAQAALELVGEYTREHGLTIHPEKTKVVDSAKSEPFEFLGYRFVGHRKYVSKKSLKRFRDNVRKITRRSNRYGLAVIIQRLNKVLRGWFEYFKHTYKTVLSGQDGWIRRRLRLILRKYNKRTKGSGISQTDHKRWPNKFFSDNGLFCLGTARLEVVQSLQQGTC